VQAVNNQPAPAVLLPPLSLAAPAELHGRMKIIWNAIEALVKRGLTSDVAIDQIYSECGGQTTKVNDVIKLLNHFRQVGNASLHMYVQWHH